MSTSGIASAGVSALLRRLGSLTHPTSSPSEPRDTPAPRALILASVAYEGHQLYDQKLARALLHAGREVVYVEPALPVVRRAHYGGARAARRVTDEGVTLLTPKMTPFGRRAPLAAFTAVLGGVQVRALLRSAGVGRGSRGRDETEVFVCGAHPVLVRFFRRWPRVAIVLDDYPSGGGLIGVDPGRVRRQRRALLRDTPTVAAVSPYLREILLHDGVDAVVVPPGTEPVASALPEPEALRAVPHPRAAFMGMMSDRIDFDLLTAVVEQGATLVLAGRSQLTFNKGEELSRLLASGRAVHLGELGPADLDAALSHCDVGLVPYTLTEFNLASFPLKIFEYLAAGLPVLSSDLPAARWIERPEVHVVPAGADPTAAIRGVLAAASEPDVARRCRDAAAANGWDRRVEVLSALARRRA